MVNVRSLLDEHEATVVARIDNLRAQLLPLERELREVRLAKAALRREIEGPEQRQIVFFPSSDGNVSSSHEDAWRQRIVDAGHASAQSPYARMTIKDLVKKALAEHFEHGATANQLLDLFANVWGRTDVARTSLSPQLSRLKQESIVFRDGQIWRLKAASQEADLKKTATDQ